MQELRQNPNHQPLFKRSAAVLTTAAFLAGTVLWGARPALADSVAPPAPANMRVSPSGISTDGTAILTWDAAAATDVAYYQIFRYSGAQSPAASELTYLGRTEDTRTYFIDHAPGEGQFRYAVMAVDQSGNAGQVSAWVGLTVDLPTNGSGNVVPDTTAPDAASAFAAGAAYRKERAVTLTWTGSQAPDLWRYLVYRADGAQAPKMIAYVAAGTNTYTDTVTADNSYRYYIIAQDKTGNASAASANASTVVDAAAPVVQITAPVAGQTYLQGSTITIAATITEGAAGYEASAVKYFLDGAQVASPTLNLTGLSIGSHTVKVEVADRAGNVGSAQASFLVNSATVDPTAPRSLTAPQYSKSRSVSLSWSAPASGTVTQYMVYRTTGTGSAVLVGATQATITQYTDMVPADGLYSYYVVASNGTSVGQPSNLAATQVDTVAPTINVGAPISGKRYEKNGTLAVQVTVSDAGSGYEPSAVKLYLDGSALTGSTINLAALSEGSHAFKVEARDRAGNIALKTVSFSVGQVDDDDEDDDDDHHKAPRRDLLDLLTTLRNKIHHGHFSALWAKAKSGNIKSFEEHVRKHRGKFIDKDAADKLLKALEEHDED